MATCNYFPVNGTIRIGDASNYIIGSGSGITISTDWNIEFSGQIYREQFEIADNMIAGRIQNFENMMTSSMTISYPQWSNDTVHDAYPEEVTIGDYYLSTTDITFTPSYGEWRVISDFFYPHDMTIKEATHAEVMQKKIDEAWALYCRNENHPKEMQARIEREWWAHLEEERIAEAERIRLLSEKKANELMSMLIGEREHKVYEKTGRVFVKGKNGLYLVKRGGGVSKIEGNNITDFCVHIEFHYNCPPTDHAIALKMMLEDDDSNVIKIANRRMTRQVKELPLAACM